MQSRAMNAALDAHVFGDQRRADATTKSHRCRTYSTREVPASKPYSEIYRTLPFFLLHCRIHAASIHLSLLPSKRYQAIALPNFQTHYRRLLQQITHRTVLPRILYRIDNVSSNIRDEVTKAEQESLVPQESSTGWIDVGMRVAHRSGYVL
ncbi:hypothetical protein BC629DRAFT_1000371 [Irpex lacteus]|nr:hypothetical protein BC629DRAFT_1000371 [Irpex lacteus]